MPVAGLLTRGTVNLTVAKANLEPKVSNAAAVTRQIIERVKAIEMIDGEVSNLFWRREPEIDRDTAAPVRFEAQAPPTKHATARRAEADFKYRISFACTRIGSARTRDADALAFVVISPERAIAATKSAVACRGRTGIALKGPLAGAAMAGAC